MSKLLPCPFCGNEAVTFEPDDERNIVSCKLGHAKFRTIEGWNTRASERVEEENKRLKSKIGEYEEASAICPEDVGFVEYIKYLQSKNKEMRQLLKSAKIALECNPQTFPNTVKAIREFLEENK